LALSKHFVYFFENTCSTTVFLTLKKQAVEESLIFLVIVRKPPVA